MMALLAEPKSTEMDTSADRIADGIPETVQIEDITIGSHRRDIQSEIVEELIASIKEVGLLQPIGITEDYQLIFGAGRIEACKRLGWKTIPAVKFTFDKLHAELAEIDENIRRAALTALEESKALARRKAIWEALHAEKKHGGDRKSAAARSSGQHGHLKSFAEDTAAKTGKSARTIRRDADIGENLDDAAADVLKDTPIADNKRALKAVADKPKGEQVKAAKAAVDGSAQKNTSVEDADSATERKVRGVGVFRAHEAIDCLKRIPENDRLRKRGFQIVMDWIKSNQ